MTRIENVGTGALAAGIATLGWVFAQGELPATHHAQATLGGNAAAVQVDVTNTWPDGSARMAKVAVARPALAAGASLPLVLTAVAGAAGGTPIDLSVASQAHACTITTTTSGQSAVVSDVLALLRAAIAGGTLAPFGTGRVYWRRGPLVTEARVIVLLAGSLRLVCDVAAYAGGGLSVDVQFANDRAMQAQGGRVAYTAAVAFGGASALTETVDQWQYSVWSRVFRSGPHGGQGLADGSGRLNITPDPARLATTHALWRYDDTTWPIAASVLAEYATRIAEPGWGAPLATAYLQTDMPSAGGRPDIGPVTGPIAAWLISKSPVAAAYALGQAEAAGSVPWNMWDQPNGTWVNTANRPDIWTDRRGGQLTQQHEARSLPAMPWAPDTSHQPSLSWVPLLLTGRRYYWDRQAAVGVWQVTYTWNLPRGPGPSDPAFPYGDLVIAFNQQRAVAWCLREISHAAWGAPDGSTEGAYLEAVQEENIAYLAATPQERPYTHPKWGASMKEFWAPKMGEAHGYFIPEPSGTKGLCQPWQDDMIFTVLGLMLRRTQHPVLRRYLDWAKNFPLTMVTHGAVTHSPAMAIRIGLKQGMYFATPNVDQGGGPREYSVMLTTWAAIEAANDANGRQNDINWSIINDSGGFDYVRMKLAALAELYRALGDPAFVSAYDAVVAADPPRITPAARGIDPQWNMVAPTGAPPPPPPPVLTIASTSADKPEGATGPTAYTFTVTRAGDLSGATSATWTVTGSGTNPAAAADFVGGALPSGTVSFAAGQATRPITVDVAGDSVVEPDEGFTVTLSGPVGASLGTATAGGVIRNDDAAPPPPPPPPPPAPPVSTLQHRVAVRDEVAAILRDAVPLVGSRVFRARTWGLTERQLPALLVYGWQEEKKRIGGSAVDAFHDVSFTLAVEVRVADRSRDGEEVEAELELLTGLVTEAVCTAPTLLLTPRLIVSVEGVKTTFGIDTASSELAIGRALVAFDLAWNERFEVTAPAIDCGPTATSLRLRHVI